MKSACTSTSHKIKSRDNIFILPVVLPSLEDNSFVYYRPRPLPSQLSLLEGIMAHEQPSKSAPQKLVIRNIGLLLSGDLAKPILDADTIVAVGDRITVVGKEKDVDSAGATVVIDAKGTALAPGLIDSHVHPVCGDWTPRQNQLGWIDSYMNGGVTTMVSAGEVHTPGRPKA